MWICSQLGFFSIVRKGGTYHVRARVRGDLENLLEAAGLDLEIHQSPDADYRWRILVTESQLATLMATFGDSVDYPNFKSRIHSRPDQVDKAPAYGNLWADLYQLQNRE